MLFSTHDEVEHLALMERTLGSLPPGLVRRASARKMDKNFRHGTLRWPDRAYDRASEAHVRAQPRLKDALRGEPHIAPMRWVPQLADFYDLLWRLLEYEPQDRLSAVDALKHPFVAAAAAMAAAPVTRTLNPTPIPTPTPTPTLTNPNLTRAPNQNLTNPNPNPNPTPKPKPKPNPAPNPDPDPNPALAPAPALTLSGTGGGAPPSGVLRLPQRRQATACAPRLGH